MNDWQRNNQEKLHQQLRGKIMAKDKQDERLQTSEEIKAIRKPMSFPNKVGEYGLQDVCLAIAEAQLAKADKHRLDRLQIGQRVIVREFNISGWVYEGIMPERGTDETDRIYGVRLDKIAFPKNFVATEVWHCPLKGLDVEHRLDRPKCCCNCSNLVAVDEGRHFTCHEAHLLESPGGYVRWYKPKTVKECRPPLNKKPRYCYNYKPLALIPDEEEIRKQERIETGEYLEHCHLSPYETHRLISIHDIERLKSGQALKQGKFPERGKD